MNEKNELQQTKVNLKNGLLILKENTHSKARAHAHTHTRARTHARTHTHTQIQNKKAT
jgi:hypothetical protein